MTATSDEILARLDAEEKILATKVLEIEESHKLKGRTKIVDEEITEAIVNAVKRLITGEKEATT